MADANLILTGIPRSGTTLAVALLDRLSDTLALSEPMDIQALARCRSTQERLGQIAHYFGHVRQLARQQLVPQQVVAGETTNLFAQTANGHRRSTVIGHSVRELRRPVSEKHLCVIKHPNAFTALLEELVGHFECLAIVRNPVAVISSWNSLDAPLAAGHAPMAECFDHRLRAQLAALPDALERQTHLLGWYFERYLKHLDTGRVVKYEDIVRSGGAALYAALPGWPGASRREDFPAVSLRSRNISRLYDAAFMKKVCNHLIAQAEHPLWNWYTRQDLRGVVLG